MLEGRERRGKCSVMDNTTQPFGLSRWKRNAIPSKVIYVYIFVREDGTRTYSALRLLIKSSAAVWRPPPPRKRKSTTKTNDSAKLLLRTNLTLILFDPLEDVSNGQDVVPFDIAESILRCFAHRRKKMFFSCGGRISMLRIYRSSTLSIRKNRNKRKIIKDGDAVGLYMLYYLMILSVRINRRQQ